LKMQEGKSYIRKNSTSNEIFTISKIDDVAIIFTNGARVFKTTFMNEFVEYIVEEINPDTFFNGSNNIISNSIKNFVENPNNKDLLKQYEENEKNGFIPQNNIPFQENIQQQSPHTVHNTQPTQQQSQNQNQHIAT